MFLRNFPLVPPSASSSSSASSPVIRSRRRKAPPTDNADNDSLSSNIVSELVAADVFAVPPDDDDGGSSTDEEEPAVIDSDEGEESSPEAFLPPTWSTSGYHFNPPVNEMSVTVPRSIQQYSSPIEFFHLFLTQEFIEKIVEATNIYGSAKIKQKWLPTTTEEIKRIFAAVIFMGIFGTNNIQNYFSRDCKTEFMSKLFPSRDRFLSIYQCFYINRGGRNVRDPLWHVRPLINLLSETFPLYYTPSHVLTLDEALVPCKARSTLKQYIKSKPHKWGYKVWCLVNEEYLLRFEVYAGKRGNSVSGKPLEVAQR